VIIDLTDSHIWDASSVAALDQVVTKYAHHDKTVELIGMNAPSRRIHEDLARQLASSHFDRRRLCLPDRRNRNRSTVLGPREPTHDS
jgi:MFS superfamily sulfate permease-like transporter